MEYSELTAQEAFEQDLAAYHAAADDQAAYWNSLPEALVDARDAQLHHDWALGAFGVEAVTGGPEQLTLPLAA